MEQSDIPLLSELVVVLGISVLILLICYRLKVPSVVGLLLTGVLAGPYGIGLVYASHDVEALAEIGVILLLFTIGIEFSLSKLFDIRRMVVIGGGLQVVLTILVSWLIGSLVGLETSTAIFCGFLVALGSTAIVLKSLQERGEIESPHGRASLGILIFQDIVIVPMMLVVPLLAGNTENPAGEFLELGIKTLVVLGVVWVGSRFVVPWLLHQIARTRSRELFVLSVVVICFAVAWMTSALGLSLGMGAFLAGLIISESEYSHQTLGGILPFRDVFTSVFFVSIGMLLNTRVLVEQPLVVPLVLVGVILLKMVVAGGAILILRLPLRTAAIVGISLAQIGEFAFVLARVGISNELFSEEFYQIFLAASVLSMALTPILIAIAPRIADRLARLPLPKWVLAGVEGDGSAPKQDEIADHIIICGFGITGRNIARAARASSISYIVIETNPDTVRHEQKLGRPILFGDASYTAVLQRAGIENARILAIVINDPVAVRGVIQTARSLNPELQIIVRTRFVREIDALKELGANNVIPEEFETSVEIFSRIMAMYLIPQEDIEQFVEHVRHDEYEMFRTLQEPTGNVAAAVSDIPDLQVSAMRIPPGSPFTGETIAGIALRPRFGVTLLEIRRESSIIPNPDGETRLAEGDVIVVIGPHDRRIMLRRAIKESMPTK